MYVDHEHERDFSQMKDSYVNVLAKKLLQESYLLIRNPR